jgi:hypothetical protein
MRRLLWDHWDPLALKGVAPDDEYDAYARVLASKLKRGDDRAEIVRYLTAALAQPGCSLPSQWRAKCEAAADTLMEWYARSEAPDT